MTPHGESHLRRAAEMRERVLDFQGQIENLRQAIADAEGAALVLEMRSGQSVLGRALRRRAERMSDEEPPTESQP